MYCSDCNKETEFDPVTREETLTLRGELITAKLPYVHCSVCGKERVPGDYDTGLQIVYDEYRRRKGLPGPKEIQGLREKCGMNHEEFAAVTGMTLLNLWRCEKGELIQEGDAARLKKLGLAVPAVQAEPRNLLIFHRQVAELV